MPAKMTLFDALCKPVFDLGNGPYSIARWNPFGRFFIIAGFGNLPGEGCAAAQRSAGRRYLRCTALRYTVRVCVCVRG